MAGEGVGRQSNPVAQIDYIVIFWINLTAHLVLPFSLYLHLLAPTFLDQDEFNLQVEDILTHSYSEPMPFYTAFSYLGLTRFGKDIFQELL